MMERQTLEQISCGIGSGGAGPRVVTLHRSPHGFGFTLRHFIVYPPSGQDDEDEVYESSQFLQPMDTIFVKVVRPNSPADQAGLKTGDRIVAVNGQSISGSSYGTVVQLVQKSAPSLHLLVVSKEDDILQKYFSHTANRPETNPRPHELASPSHHMKSQIQKQFSHLPYPKPYVPAVISQNNLPYSTPLRAQLTSPHPISSPHSLPISSPIQSSSPNLGLNIQSIPYIDDGVKSPTHSSSSHSSSSSTLRHVETRPEPVPRIGRDEKGRVYEVVKQRALQIRSNRHVTSHSDRPLENGYSEENWKMLNNPTSGLQRKNSYKRDSMTSLQLLPSQIYDLPTSDVDKRASVVSAVDTQELQQRYSNADPVIDRIKTSFKQKEEFLLRPNTFNNLNVPPTAPQRSKGYYAVPHKFQRLPWPPPSLQKSGSTTPSSVASSELISPKQPLSASLSAPVYPSNCDKSPLYSNGAFQDNKNQKGYVSTLDKISENMVVNGELSPVDYIESVLPGSSPHIVCERMQQFENNARCSSRESSPFTEEISKLNSKHDIPDIERRKNSLQRRKSADVIMNPPGNPASGNRLTIVGGPRIHCEPPGFDFAGLEELEESVGSSPVHEVVPRRKAVRQNSYLTAIKSPLSSQVGEGLLDGPQSLPPQHTPTSHNQPSTKTERKPSIYEEDEDSDMDSDYEHRDPKRARESGHNIHKLRALFGEDDKENLQPTSPAPTVVPPVEVPSPQQPIYKEGVLNVKVVVADGKKSVDRSWKQIWAVLTDSHLYLLKDKRAGAQSPMELGVTDSPIIIDSCQVDVAYDYTKKKNVFRLETCNGWEYLLQADSSVNMVQWIHVIQDAVHRIQEGTATQDHMYLMSALERSKLKKLTSFRNRSPTGHSPAAKARKASTQSEISSPKSKNWKGRVVQQFKKIHTGASTAQSPSQEQPPGTTFGVHLHACPPSSMSTYIPLIIELCTSMIDARGLNIIGIYRIPGNNAAVCSLSDSLNKGFEHINLQDPRWNDMNVISSVLKSFLRKLPDPVITVDLYSQFISASKINDQHLRLLSIKKLLGELPLHHFHTLKYLILHLWRVANNSTVNKMDCRNLAIVFGPTLVRQQDDNMAGLITDMAHQCQLVETLIAHADWFFENEDLCMDSSTVDVRNAQFLSVPATQVSKEMTAKEIVSSIIEAANRKSEKLSKEIVSSIIEAANRKSEKLSKEREEEQYAKQVLCSRGSIDGGYAPSHVSSETLSPTSTSVGGDEVVVPWKKDELRERILEFEQETRAMLSRDAHRSALDTKRTAEQRSRLEHQWRKAKTDLENEDLLDRLADNPSEIAKKMNALEHCVSELRSAVGGHPPHHRQTSSTVDYGASAPPGVRNAVPTPWGAETLHRFMPFRVYHSPRPLRRGISAENVYTPTPPQPPTTKTNHTGDIPTPTATSFGRTVASAFQGIHSLQPPVNNSMRCGSLDSLRDFYDKEPPPPPVPPHQNIVKHSSQDDDSSLLCSISATLDARLHVLMLTRAGHMTSPQLPQQQHTTYTDPSLHQLPHSKKESGSSTASKCSSETTSLSSQATDQSSTSHAPRSKPRENNLQHADKQLKNTQIKLQRSESLTKSEKTDINLSKYRENLLQKQHSVEEPEIQHIRRGSVREIRDKFEKGPENTTPKRRTRVSYKALKRRHTVSGTKEFEKFKTLLYHASLSECVGSAWERLQPAVGSEERDLTLWLGPRGLRGSSPDLTNNNTDTVKLKRQSLPESILGSLESTV